VPSSLGSTVAWSEVPISGQAPDPREDHTWTVDGDGASAWLFGGRDGGDVFGDLWRYDLASDAWERVEVKGDSPSPRFGHTATWVPGIGLVVWSGQAGSAFFNDLWAFDPADGRWTALAAEGQVPPARYGSCAALAPDGRLWVSHGFTDTGRFSDTRAYDFEAGGWEDLTVDGTRPIERCLHDCLWTPDERFVLYAGQTDGVQALGDLWSLAPPDRWEELTDVEPEARQLYALAQVGSAGYVFGGRDEAAEPLQDLWRLDLEDLTWSRLEAGGEMPPVRSGAALVADPNSGRLLLFGGLGRADTLADLWELTVTG
jgi:hypothetical protein